MCALCYIGTNKLKFQGPGSRERDGVAMVQQLRKSITLLAFFLFSGVVLGQQAQGPLTIKADAPDRYTVVRGDPPWGISQRYTDSPWRWPELWNMNREQIRNPHLIYPGYVILLDRIRGRLSISSGESSGQTISGTGTEPPTSTGMAKLSPRARAEMLAKQEIPRTPPAAIEPFLRRPLVIEPDGFDRAPTIIATEKDRVILAAGNIAYVRGIVEAGEETWYVYRQGAPLVDPDTERTLAYEAIYLGTAQVTRAGNPATVVLTSAVQEVNAGDR